jgi:hypothetical protein
MSLVYQERVTVTVTGNGTTLSLGVFDSFSGGSHKAENQKHRPGSMGTRKSLGGPGDRDDFSVGRLYELLRDHPHIKTLDGLVGIGEVHASRQKLNPDKSAFGEPVNYTGTLVAVNYPDHDSDSSDKAMFSLDVSADEPIS